MFGLTIVLAIIWGSCYLTITKVYGNGTHIVIIVLALILQQVIYFNSK